MKGTVARKYLHAKSGYMIGYRSYAAMFTIKKESSSPSA